DNRVVWLDLEKLEKLIAQEPYEPQRRHESRHHTDAYQARAFAQHHTQHPPAFGAHSHANPDLPRAPGHRISQHAVDAQRGQQQARMSPTTPITSYNWSGAPGAVGARNFLPMAASSGQHSWAIISLMIAVPVLSLMSSLLK